MSAFLTAALGAFFGLCAGLSLEWWKSGREDLRDLCKGFAQLITDASDVGAEFWLTAGSDRRSSEASLARVAGFVRRIDGYLTILDGRLDPESIDDVESEAAKFLRAMTGGDPQDPAREASFERACAVHDAAGAVVVAIRRASYRRMSFKQRVERFASRSWVNQTFTMRLPPANPFPGDRESPRARIERRLN